MVPPAPFLHCEPHLATCGSWVHADPARIDEKFRDTSLEEFDREVHGWLPLFPVVSLPG